MGMLQQYAGQELIWGSSHTAKRTYELRAGDQILATLTQPSAWHERRTGTSDEGKFSFARTGFFKQRTVITDTATNAEVASMPTVTWGGTTTLTLTDGRVYHWHQTSFWASKWGWLDDTQQPMMSFKPLGVFRARCAVIIEPAAAADPHLGLLAQLGWFQILLAQAAIAASSAASSAAASRGVISGSH